MVEIILLLKIASKITKFIELLLLIVILFTLVGCNANNIEVNYNFRRYLWDYLIN